MVFWRKKNDGFEWQRYVRTTKLIRRKERREKLEEVGAAAVFGAKRAAWYSLERLQDGARNAFTALARTALWSARKTKSAAIISYRTLLATLNLAWLWTRRAGKHAGHCGGLAARHGAVAGGRAAKAAATKAREVAQQRILPAAQRAGERASQGLSPGHPRLSVPDLSLSVAIVAAISGLCFAGLWIAKGMTALTVLTGALCLAAMGAIIMRRGFNLSTLSRLRLPAMAPPTALPHSAAWASAGLAAILGAIFAVPYAYDGLKKVPSFANIQLPSFAITTGTLLQRETIVGRATAINGDRLKIKTKVIQLDGIEAPLPRQTCRNSRSRTWSCGWRAKQALAKLIRRRSVTCDILSTKDDGTILGRCSTGEADIAEAVVRNGYAFADSGFFSRYADAESEAQATKRGIWQGEAHRPQAYRDKLWQTAADKAPDGCPIKAMKKRGRQLYALPWDRAYSRISTRKRRGGRWFCSEQEAVSAGYQRAS